MSSVYWIADARLETLSLEQVAVEPVVRGGVLPPYSNPVIWPRKSTKSVETRFFLLKVNAKTGLDFLDVY